MVSFKTIDLGRDPYNLLHPRILLWQVKKCTLIELTYVYDLNDVQSVYEIHIFAADNLLRSY